MDDVDLDVVDVHELAVVRHALHVQQAAGDLDHLAHGLDGRRRRIPTFDASVPPGADSELDPGARSSSVEKVAASNPTFRVQEFTTPEPIAIRSVTAANAAIGTVTSRTRRLSACQTASKPLASASCA